MTNKTHEVRKQPDRSRWTHGNQKQKVTKYIKKKKNANVHTNKKIHDIQNTPLFFFGYN